MQRRSCHRRHNLGNNRPVVIWEASRRKDRSCSRKESRKSTSEKGTMEAEAQGTTYNRRLDEPARVAYRVEKRECFLHTVLSKVSRKRSPEVDQNENLRQSHPRTTSDRTRSVTPRTPTPSHSRNSGSTFYVHSSVLRHQTTCRSVLQP